MNRSIFIIILLLGAASFVVTAQGTFTPRDADEEQAWRLYNAYKESRRIEAPLEAQIKAKFNDAFENAVGSAGILGVDWEANAEAKKKVEQLAVERKRQADLLAAWEKKFYWRYGDLRWADERIYDRKTKREMDRIEFAMICFPFNYKPGKVDAAEPAGPSTQGTFSAEKGTADQWSHITVTVGKVANFKTDDRPGWRNNGTGFSAVSIGTHRVTIKIDMTGKAGVSYFDYTSGVSVKTSDGKALLAEQPVISKDGGSKSYMVVWDPDLNPDSVTVSVRMTGGNPEFFTNFVTGSITIGRGLTSSNGPVSNPNSISDATPPAVTATDAKPPVGDPKTMFTTGNDYGVSNGGTPPKFVVSSPATITQIMTYHWNEGRGAPGGTIALRDAHGKVLGPWNVSVRAKVYWEVNQQIKLPPGTYTVIDSDPSTWAQNAQTGGKGMVVIKGIN